MFGNGVTDGSPGLPSLGGMLIFSLSSATSPAVPSAAATRHGSRYGHLSKIPPRSPRHVSAGFESKLPTRGPATKPKA